MSATSWTALPADTVIEPGVPYHQRLTATRTVKNLKRGKFRLFWCNHAGTPHQGTRRKKVLARDNDVRRGAVRSCGCLRRPVKVTAVAVVATPKPQEQPTADHLDDPVQVLTIFNKKVEQTLDKLTFRKWELEDELNKVSERVKVLEGHRARVTQVLETSCPG